MRVMIVQLVVMYKECPIKAKVLSCSAIAIWNLFGKDDSTVVRLE
jgi:hypothetical protein